MIEAGVRGGAVAPVFPLPAFRLGARLELSVVGAVVVFAVGLFAAAVWGGGRQAVHTLGAVPRVVVPVMLAMSLLNYAARSWRWLGFSRAMGVHVPPGRNALYYIAGFAMTTTPGKLGEALRLWLLRRGHGCRYEESAGLLIADRLFDALSTTVVVAISVAWMAQYAWVAVLAVAAVGGIGVLCLRPALLLQGVDGLYSVLRRRGRLFVRARRALRPLQLLASPRAFGQALALSAAGWLSEGLSLFVLLHALGVGLHPLTCVFIFSFSMLVGAVSVLPGGLGSTEATMVGLLVAQSVPFETALVATGVVRVTTLWFAVGLGLLALPWALHLVRGEP